MVYFQRLTNSLKYKCIMFSVSDCDFPKLPKQLEEILPANEFALFRHRWNSNEVRFSNNWQIVFLCFYVIAR